MSEPTCDYCSQGANDKGPVRLYDGGFTHAHAECYKKAKGRA
ncbi:MAG TPA: hypothetical protein VGG75_14050 [Trebonia sp.]